MMQDLFFIYLFICHIFKSNSAAEQCLTSNSSFDVLHLLSENLKLFFKFDINGEGMGQHDGLMVCTGASQRFQSQLGRFYVDFACSPAYSRFLPKVQTYIIQAYWSF